MAEPTDITAVILREIRDELLDFKEEFREFKSEMYEFKSEMYEFKSEMYEFKDNTESRFDRMDRSIAGLRNEIIACRGDIMRVDLQNAGRIAVVAHDVSNLNARLMGAERLEDRMDRVEADVAAIKRRLDE